MHLIKTVDDCNHPIALGHFMHLVSAYEDNSTMINELSNGIKEAQIKAKERMECVVVTQDSNDHIFVVHPSGRISLYCSMGTYEIAP